MAIDKDFYNAASSSKLGWEPSWFGCVEFDYNLVKAVQKWQRNIGLTADGLVGPTTYRRVWTEREASISSYSSANRTPCTSRCDERSIVHNGNFIPIKWDKVILWDDQNGFRSNPGCYTNLSGKPDRNPTMFVNHWDVCLSSESCAKVLNKRGVSVHFLIDNDGTIYQMLDTQHKAWHAGIPKNVGGNSKGIGVEISNAYYPKYQEWYTDNNFGERPLIDDAYVHGRKLAPFLGFYPVQIEALKALWAACSSGIGIKMDYPKDIDGSLCTTVVRDCQRGKFEGICNHYNFTNRKIDCAGLPIGDIIDGINNS